MASTTRAEPRMTSPGPIHSGSVAAAAKATNAPTGLPTRTSVRSRSDAGRSRTLPASASDDSTSRSVRLAKQLAHHDRGEHDGRQDGEPERGVGRVVPRHPLLEDAERHGRGGDDRQFGEVAQGERGERGHQGGQPEGGIEREAEDRRLEEDADEGQDAGHHPGHRLQAPDRDAEHGGPVAAVADGLHGEPDVATGEPERDGGQAGHRDDDRHQVVGVEDDGADVPGELPGEARHRGGDGRLAPDPRDEQAQDDEELGQADGGHGEDQPGRAPEAPHHQDLDGGREEERGHQAGGEPEEVVDAGEADEPDGEHGRCRAQVALGEVDHLVQAVGEAEADGHEGAEEAEHRALEPDPERHREQEELDGEDRPDGDRHRHRCRRTPRQPQMGGQRLMPFSWSCLVAHGELAPPGSSLADSHLLVLLVARLRVAVRR